jgi:mannan endo-1,6-alpha-mannosidase
VIDNIIETASGVFFPEGVMKEVACEDNGKCDVDQRSFKAYLSRWTAATIKLAPWTKERLEPLLRSSAQKAIATCSGGADQQQCGLRWTTGAFDGSVGVGEQMAVLEVMQSTLIDTVLGPKTASTGGTSKGDPGAGGGGKAQIEYDNVTTGDKVGAAIATLIIIGAMFGGSLWMILS